MDFNAILGLTEAQSRNDEMMLIETVAMQRETASQLRSAQEQMALLKEKEKQLIEKVANLTSITETQEATIHQLKEDLKGSKTEMAIVKEYAANHEALLRAAKLDYLSKIDALNEKFMARNKDIDKLLGLVDKVFPENDSIPMNVDQSVPSEELTLKQKEIGDLQEKLEANTKVIQELHKEIEKANEFENAAQKAMADYQEMVDELRSLLKQPCENCGNVRPNVDPQ